MDSVDPRWKQSKALSPDPMRANPYSDSADPRRPKDRRDMELPM
jgi:hypothetical protein